jgi:hypothetical protein
MLPLRKITSSRVALTSYFGKTFVTRGRKKTHDYGAWLNTKIMIKVLSQEDKDLTQVLPANVFDPALKAPRSYTAISTDFKSITTKGYTLYFEQETVKKLADPVLYEKTVKQGNLIVGMHPKGSVLILDSMGALYTLMGEEMTPAGTIESFLNIPTDYSPVEFAEVGVFGKDVPIGIVLAYYMGFSELMKSLRVTPKRIEAGKRVALEPSEYSLVFSDETLVFSRDDRIAAMVLGGFLDYHRVIRLFSVYSFDKRAIYLNLLESNKLSARYLREMDLMNQMFIDPITKQLLEQLKLPETFQGLLLKACELLLDDAHPDELDPRQMRIKGYERISGAVYSELVQSLRQHNGMLGKSNKKIEMNPYSVWKKIVEDPSKSQTNEINPIEALKEVEAVTYAGVGGRSKVSMVKNTRAYHRNDMGTVSESTVDSSDVAINVYLSANPKLNSLLGTSTDFDMGKDGATSLLSTSALLAPFSDRDD